MARFLFAGVWVDLRAVTVRPTWGAREHRRWDDLVAAHHYLRFHGIMGKGLRHVAVHGEAWLALVGWQPGAFKVGARDRWIGWSAEQQFRRLHLVANNSRFVILTPERVPNLASRVLGLSVRRLSQDLRAAPRLRSLFECLGEVPEYRHARGKRYALTTILTLAVAARLAGYRGVNAFAQFAALLSPKQLKAVGAFWSPSRQCYTPPAVTTFHNILAALRPQTLDNAIGQWAGQHSSAHAPVAMDGKDLRGASKQTEDRRRRMVAAVAHDTGSRPCAHSPSVSTSQAGSSPSMRCTPSTRPRVVCSNAVPTTWSAR